MSNYIVPAIVMLVLFFVVFIGIRNRITYAIQTRAGDYIFRYRMGAISSFERSDSLDFKKLDELLAKVDYSDIESYGVTVFKFWHNSWEDVLSPEKVILLKEYLKEDVHD